MKNKRKELKFIFCDSWILKRQNRFLNKKAFESVRKTPYATDKKRNHKQGNLGYQIWSQYLFFFILEQFGTEKG